MGSRNNATSAPRSLRARPIYQLTPSLRLVMTGNEWGVEEHEGDTVVRGIYGLSQGGARRAAETEYGLTLHAADGWTLLPLPSLPEVFVP